MVSQNSLLPVTKLAADSEKFARPLFPYANARTAFKAFLSSLKFSSEDEIWLPAYIGWSSREGSGVFDPVQEVGVRVRFYRMTDMLEIDIDYLFEMFSASQPRLLVLIHYFGFPDKNLDRVVQWANERQIIILEDEAHALYSDWIGQVCGRHGEAAIMSLHKMLPIKTGGLLLLNNRVEEDTKAFLIELSSDLPIEHNILSYDLSSIAMVRRRNSEKLLQLLEPLQDRVLPLHTYLPEGVIPQTIPVRIYGCSRDELYSTLNSLGYGVVSLYHTLISPISKSQFPASYALSKNILNLPIHQDISFEQLEALTQQLYRLIF